MALPRGLGHLMLGSIWRPTYPLVLPTTLFVMGMCAATGAGIGLHALAAARHSLRAMLFGSALAIAFALTGAITAGTVGAMWYSAAASWLGAMVFWIHLRQALRKPARHRRPAALPRVNRRTTNLRSSSVADRDARTGDTAPIMPQTANQGDVQDRM